MARSVRDVGNYPNGSDRAVRGGILRDRRRRLIQWAWAAVIAVLCLIGAALIVTHLPHWWWLL